jgi:hypothetical protein
MGRSADIGKEEPLPQFPHQHLTLCDCSPHCMKLEATELLHGRSRLTIPDTFPIHHRVAIAKTKNEQTNPIRRNHKRNKQVQ